MKLAVIAFTRAGSRYALRIVKALEERGAHCEAYGKGKELLLYTCEDPRPALPVSAEENNQRLLLLWICMSGQWS